MTFEKNKKNSKKVLTKSLQRDIIYTEREVINMKKEFRILTKAEMSYLKKGELEKGYIIEYEGELYFIIEDGISIYDENIWLWRDIERYFIYYEVEDCHNYYQPEGILRKLDINSLKGNLKNEKNNNTTNKD